MSLLMQLKHFFADKTYPFVLLFGSYSDATFNEMSDVDIGIFYANDVDYKDLGYTIAMLETEIDKKVDMIALNDIYKKDPLFAFKILQNHTPLLMNDEKAYIAFKTASQLYYLDHKPLIAMNERMFAQRIENNQIGERNFVTET